MKILLDFLHAKKKKKGKQNHKMSDQPRRKESLINIRARAISYSLKYKNHFINQQFKGKKEKVWEETR